MLKLCLLYWGSLQRKPIYNCIVLVIWYFEFKFKIPAKSLRHVEVLTRGIEASRISWTTHGVCTWIKDTSSHCSYSCEYKNQYMTYFLPPYLFIALGSNLHSKHLGQNYRFPLKKKEFFYISSNIIQDDFGFFFDLIPKEYR